MFLATKTIIRSASICNRPRHKFTKINMSAFIRMAWRRFQFGTPYSRFRTVNNGLLIGSLTLTCRLSYIERKWVAEEKWKLQERAYQLKKDQLLKYQQGGTEPRKGGDKGPFSSTWTLSCQNVIFKTKQRTKSTSTYFRFYIIRCLERKKKTNSPSSLYSIIQLMRVAVFQALGSWNSKASITSPYYR